MAGWLLSPVMQVMDYSADLTTAPRYFATKYIKVGDRENFKHALSFAITCLPIGMFLQRIGFSFLGLEGAPDYLHWVYVTLGALLFVSTTVLVMSVFHRASFKDVFHIALFPLGVLWIVSPAVFLTASVTVWLLHQVGYIPDFHLDRSNFDNFELTQISEYLSCVMEANRVFAALLSIRLDGLMPPIKYLPYCLGSLSVFYMCVYGVLLAYTLHKSLLVSALSVLIAAIVYYGTVAGGALAIGYFAAQSANCMDRATDVANMHTQKHQLELYLQNTVHPRIGRVIGGARLTEAKLDGTSIITVFEVPLGREQVLLDSMEEVRSSLKQAYCANETSTHLLRRLGANLVHIYRNSNGAHVYTFVVNQDDCRT